MCSSCVGIHPPPEAHECLSDEPYSLEDPLCKDSGSGGGVRWFICGSFICFYPIIPSKKITETHLEQFGLTFLKKAVLIYLKF